MAAQFQAFNENGILQVDGTLRTVERIQWGVKRINPPSRGVFDNAWMHESQHGIWLNNDSNTDRMPMFFARPATSNPNVVLVLDYMTSQWAYLLAYDRGSLQFVGVDVEYRVYSALRDGPDNNAGLQLFDENGNMTFQTTMAPMKISSVMRWNPGDPTSTIANTFAPEVSNPFLLMNGSNTRAGGPFFMNGWAGTNWYYYKSGLCCVGSNQVLSVACSQGVSTNGAGFGHIYWHYPFTTHVLAASTI